MRRADRISARALCWAARHMYASRTASMPPAGPPAKLLVVRIDERVGNLITLQSMLDAIGQAWPETRIGLLTSVRAAQVARNLQGINCLHEIDKRWFFRRPSAWRQVLAEIRQQAYPVAVDASAWHEFSFTHAALTYFSGAPLRVGYRRSAGAGLHSRTVLPGPSDEYESRQRMRLLRPLGISADPPQLRTELGRDQQDEWSQWLGKRQGSPARIGLWAGSRKLERRWPLSYYIRLGQSLADKGAAGLVILWGPGEEDLRDSLAAALPNAQVAPPTTLAALAGLLRGLDLLVTNDTGPMHLGVAVGTKTVALFASGEPQRWGHPYAWVRNLRVPGRQAAEVDAVIDACRELLLWQTSS